MEEKQKRSQQPTRTGLFQGDQKAVAILRARAGVTAVRARAKATARRSGDDGGENETGAIDTNKTMIGTTTGEVEILMIDDIAVEIATVIVTGIGTIGKEDATAAVAGVMSGGIADGTGVTDETDAVDPTVKVNEAQSMTRGWEMFAIVADRVFVHQEIK